MSPPSAAPSEHHRPLVACWFVFVTLIAYAVTVGLGGQNASNTPIARIAAKLSVIWDENMPSAPRVFAPLLRRSGS